MQLENSLREFVKQTVVDVLSDQLSVDTEWIDITQATAILNVDRSVIDSLVKDAPNNGFPVARLSPRVVRIDKQALIVWLRGGGLQRHGEHNQN